ncbi:hypothetical protein [Janthinobacterium sp.]|uniref:hypothetical protein n=1 Tax=Janthinobacterium sp. TaxID=1871054 RepID=UPI002636DA2E|nr:hypothetical protein [Janthinobacterium sp.]
MITFKQFLGEESTDEFSEFIHRECQPFIDKAKGSGVAIRGMDQPGRVIHTYNTPQAHPLHVHINTVRKDRKSLSTPDVYHRAIDGWMQDEFGIAARTGSVFVFGERSAHHTENYGQPYIIFPRGDFKFLWSPVVGDLYDALIMEFGPAFKMGRTDEVSPEDITRYVKSLQYTDEDFNLALQSGNEIMIECDEYYAIPMNAETMAYMEEVLA